MAKKKAFDFFKIPKTSNAGIYAIVNWEEFSCYVGSTDNLRRRASQHKTQLKKGEHISQKLQEAKNENKILRFVVLREFDFNISRSKLIFAEYCYMLEMRNKGFFLYNTNPCGKDFEKQGEILEKTIINCAVSSFGTYGHIEEAMHKEYGINTGYMRNTKYREFFAKKEIET